MAYSPTNWVDGTTKLGPTNLNKIETALTKMAYALDGAANTVPVTDGATITWQQVGNAQVAAGAAIAYSKLNLATSIVNADVSASAAIAIAKLADPTTGKVIGSAASAAAAVFPPGYEVDYVQITSNPAGVTATTEGAAATIITGTSKAYDGTKNLLHFFCPRTDNATAATTAYFVFLRGATVLGQAAVDNANGGAFHAWVEDTPAASTFSYIVKCFVSGSTQTIYAGAGGSGNRVPAFLRVTKV